MQPEGRGAGGVQGCGVRSCKAQLFWELLLLQSWLCDANAALGTQPHSLGLCGET